MANTQLLAEATECIPTIAGWYRREWADWFTCTSQEEIETDLAGTAITDRLPIGIVAKGSDATPVGFCSLRADAFEPYPHVGPWLRGLYVDIPRRGQGIAGELILAAETHARRLGIPKLYAATHSATTTFERAGWLGFDQVFHEQQALTIFGRRIG